MSLKAIEQLLEKKIGLSVETVGADTVLSVVRRRMEDCGIQDYWAYLTRLNTSEVEWDELIEAIVVPETWFLRNEESFTFLGRYIKAEWMLRHQNRALRALSMPCSTGEEPYSIAVTCLEAGLPNSRVAIDAVDISNKALRKAQRGMYGQESFRNQETLTLREQYFIQVEEGYQIDASIQHTVRFIRGNLLDDDILADSEPYDIIFCRNLLIYLSPAARKKVSETIDRLLSRTGLFFIGHAERPLFHAEGFASVTAPGVFAYYRERLLDEGSICQHSRKPSRFERRRSSRIVDSSAQPDRRGRRASDRVSEKEAAPQKPAPSMFIERRKPPDSTIKILDTARQMADQGNLEEALKLCDAVLTENAAHVQAHFLMGLIYQALKDDNQAERSFNKAIYLDPNHDEALYYLALIMEDRGQHGRAKQLRQRIHRIYQRAQGRLTIEN
jgi:chemotaxis protein methyltransferase WspC